MNDDKLSDQSTSDNWFQTHSGGQIFPANLKPENFNIEDIAAGLSKECRFARQSLRFYSVAQHSVLVSHIVPRHLAFQGLMHDAPEAFLGDMSKPLKVLLPDYQHLEEKFWRVIAMRFGLPAKLDPEVKHADLVALQTERRDIMPRVPWPWKIELMGIEPLQQTIEPIDYDAARELFLKRFCELRQNP